jgi:hypothetical protein
MNKGRPKKLRKQKQPPKSGGIPFGLKFHKLNWLEWVTVAAGIWLWFFPHPYRLAFTVVLLLPIIGLILNGISRPSIASLVSISDSKDGKKYDLADFLEFPGIVILVRVLLDFEFESFYSILKVGTLGFILLLIVLALPTNWCIKTISINGPSMLL